LISDWHIFSQLFWGFVGIVAATQLPKSLPAAKQTERIKKLI